MALITCPACGKPISDKAVKCPHCKKDVTFDADSLKEETESEIVVQSEVQSPQSRPTPMPNIVEHPKQQDSVEVDSYHDEEHSNKGLFALIAVVVIVAALCIGYYFMINQNNQETPTSDNTETVIDTLAVDTVAVSDEVENPSEFVTLDLSAFLLHGHVKKVIESDGCVICFDSNGKISDYNDGTIDLSDEYMDVTYFEHGLGLGSCDSSIDYTMDSQNRLVSINISMGNSYESEKKYSDYDKNGLPTKCKIVENYQEREEGEEELPMSEIWKQRTITTTIKYFNIDEYGNWRVKTETDNEGNTSTIHRSIEYY